MKAKQIIATIVLGLGLGACSSVSRLFDSPTQNYKNYVLTRVQTRKGYDRGRQVLALKVLAATSALKKVQEELTPSHSFDYKPQFRQVLVAVGLPNASDFGPQDLKMTLGGRSPVWIHEISSQVLLETHYFFAYPFYRVFLVDFPTEKNLSTSFETFELRTERGAVLLELNFEPGTDI